MLREGVLLDVCWRDSALRSHSPHVDIFIYDSEPPTYEPHAKCSHMEVYYIF